MTTRIPEIQKLKERIIDLPDTEIDELRIWLNAVVDVKRQLSRPKPSTTQKTNSEGNHEKHSGTD